MVKHCAFVVFTVHNFVDFIEVTIICTAGDGNQKLILFKALLLQVMCLYHKVVPHLVTESKFDFSKLLKGEFSPLLKFSSLFGLKGKQK